MSGTWTPGRPVTIRYGRFGRTRFVYTGNVLADGPEDLAVWIRPGAPTVESYLPDGRSVRDVPLTEDGRRDLVPSVVRVPKHQTWHGNAAVFVFPADAPWSVWIFFNDDGSPHRWKINLERPYTRWTAPGGAAFIDTSDRALDVVVPAEGPWRWKDEEEFAHKTGLEGYFTAELAAEIRADGERAIALAEKRVGAFDGRYTDLAGLPDWPVPDLPEDWTSPHTNWP